MTEGFIDPAGAIRTFHRETARSGRYHVMGAETGEARHVCFVLHGYGQLASRILRHFSGAIPVGMMVVAPEGLSRFYTDKVRADGAHLQHVGASWLTREDREYEIADAIRWLDGVHEAVTSSLATPTVTTSVLGFSQGVATSMRWIMRGAVRPQHFIAWAGGLAADMDLAELRERMTGRSMILVAGTDDPLASPTQVQSIQDALIASSMAYELIQYEGGHHLDVSVLRTLLPRLLSPQPA